MRPHFIGRERGGYARMVNVSKPAGGRAAAGRDWDYLSIKRDGLCHNPSYFGWTRGLSGRKTESRAFCEKCAYTRHADLKGVIERIINFKILI